MGESRWSSDALEPAAAGREAFWKGRPVWANPYTGAAARAWKTGWVSGQTELVSRAGDVALVTAEGQIEHLLELHRPQDISTPGGQPKGRARRRAIDADTATYSVTVPRNEMASGA